MSAPTDAGLSATRVIENTRTVVWSAVLDYVNSTVGLPAREVSTVQDDRAPEPEPPAQSPVGGGGQTVELVDEPNRVVVGLDRSALPMFKGTMEYVLSPDDRGTTLTIQMAWAKSGLLSRLFQRRTRRGFLLRLEKILDQIEAASR